MTTDLSAPLLLADRCRAQEELCAQLGSDLYVTLLRHFTEDVQAGGPVWTVLRDLASCPEGYYPALRLLGSVHRLVLEGRAPELAVHYPSMGGTPGPDVWTAFRAVVVDHLDELRQMVQSHPQTNEVARSGALIGGFLEVAKQTGLPLRLLEVGASAGLNLAWDHYRYESGSWAWGDNDSPVRLRDVFVDDAPQAVPVEIAERVGCDLNPIDPRTEHGRLTLLSYVWPDQVQRIDRLRASLQIMDRLDPPVIVEQAGAAEWLRSSLATSTPGQATVVVHSVVLTYFDEVLRREFDEVLEEAGDRATAEAPLGQLSLEGAGDRFEVGLRTWPGGGHRLLARTGGHGLPVQWLADA